MMASPGALIRFSIFMASNTRIGSFFFTVSPAFTKMFSTSPGVGSTFYFTLPGDGVNCGASLADLDVA